MLKLSKKKKKIAVFDIDGTIFRSSLLIELTDALIQEGIFESDVRKEYAVSYKKWLDRKDSYEKYNSKIVTTFDKNIKGVDYKTFKKIARRAVLFHKNRVYKYTRDLVTQLKKEGYYLLAISQSPREVVRPFAKEMGFDEMYGFIFEVKKGKLTGQRLHSEIMLHKDAVLQHVAQKQNISLQNSVGIGDTENDIPFLELVKRPICFNPNKNLFNYAKRKGWTIVVERKDVIYTIDCAKKSHNGTTKLKNE